MGTFLATTLLAVPIITWMTGTILLDASRLRLVRISFAPRGSFLNSRNSNSSAAAAAEFPSGRDALGEVNL
jgi:hypothetical protein